MSEFTPNISNSSIGTSTSAGVSSISSPTRSYEGGAEITTQAPALHGEVLSPSRGEIEKNEGFREIESPSKYQDGQTVASGLLDDVKEYGFRGGLERLAVGKTGKTEEDEEKESEKRTEQLKTDKKDDEKKDKKQSGKETKKKEEKEPEEDPNEKILQEIEKLLELIRELQRQNRKLIEKQKKLEAELKESQNQLAENSRDHQKELLSAITKQKKETDANITVLFERLETAQVQNAA